MGRTEQRRQYQSIIRYQLETKEPKTTSEFYDQLVQAGYHEERAVQLMAYVLETYTKMIVTSNQVFSEYEWKSYLNHVVYDVVNQEDETFDQRQERRHSRIIKQRFGDLKKNEHLLIQEMMTIEQSLYVAYLMYDISELDAKRILHIVIQTLFDEIDGTHYHYEDYVEEDLLHLAKNIIYCTDPLKNPDLKAYLDTFIDPNTPLEVLFKPVFLSLNRLLEKIDHHSKKGYFKSLARYLNVDYKQGPQFFYNEGTLNKII